MKRNAQGPGSGLLDVIIIGASAPGLLLHEPVAPTMLAACGLVVLCVAGAKRHA